MATNITKSTVAQTVWENIYNRLNADISSVNITGNVDVTVQTITNSFPDREEESKSDYPIIVINDPKLAWTNFTFDKKSVNGTFTIDVYTTQSESATKFQDAIIESIETARSELRNSGMIDVNLIDTDPDDATRGAFKLHLRTVMFEFRYIFTKTRSY